MRSASDSSGSSGAPMEIVEGGAGPAVLRISPSSRHVSHVPPDPAFPPHAHLRCSCGAARRWSLCFAGPAVDDSGCFWTYSFIRSLLCTTTCLDALPGGAVYDRAYFV